MREEVLKLAKQAKLKLTDEEIERFVSEIEKLNNEYKILENVDTDNVKPLFSTLEDKVVNRFLEDEVINTQDEIRENILDRDKMLDDFYQVPNKEGN